MTTTASDLTFNPATHTTTAPNGRDVPHVTAVLHAVGVATNFEALASMGAAMAERIQLAAARGTAVHADCHAYDDYDLDWGSVDPRVRPYVEAWAQLREDKDLVPLAHGRERQVYHPVHDYTGILDGVFVWGDRYVLLDIKTGDPEAAAAHLQTAAYEGPWNLAHPTQAATERWAAWLTPWRATPYRLVPYSARRDAYLDWQKWLACLAVYREQPGRRARA